MKKTIVTSLAILFSMLLANLAFAQDQKAIDDKLLQDYFTKNNIHPTKTASGLYYVINKKGTGENAKAGQTVTMYYIGKFMDGKKFDGNVDDNFNLIQGREPFSFPLGAGRVIKGWDEGVQLLNQGCRATLYLPSSIAYGPNNVGPIPPNSVLIFDVEVVSMK